MFSGKHFAKQKAGQVLTAATINRILDRLARLDRLSGSGPINVVQTPGGPQINWSGTILDFGFFVPTSLPVPAATGSFPNSVTAGTAQATRYYIDPNSGMFVSTKKMFKIYNWAPFPVGQSGGFIPCILSASLWTILNDACPTGGG